MASVVILVYEKFEASFGTGNTSCVRATVLNISFFEARRIIPGFTCDAIQTILIGVYVGAGVGALIGGLFGFANKKQPILVFAFLVATPLMLAGIGAVAGLSAAWFNLRHRIASATAYGLSESGCG